MATAKKAAPAKTSKTTKAAAPAKAAAAPKPIKELLGKTELAARVAEGAGVEPKVAKAVMAALEATILASLGKKAAGAFVLPGLFKVTVQQVPAKKARKGIDPFTKVERMFAAKPASTKVKVRPMKKLKDAASA
jgi:nucleoid DNA-binding protein